MAKDAKAEETKVTKVTSKPKNGFIKFTIGVGMLLVVASIAYSSAVIVLGGEDMGIARFGFLAPQVVFAAGIAGYVFIRGLSK